jgi:hypothetical protein
VTWKLVFHPSFAPEFRALDDDVKKSLGELFDELRVSGPNLGRPAADTLKGSKFANMKELRVSVASDWYRFAFAFDPVQQAVILCGGGKGGVAQELFYRSLIRTADRRFDEWLKETGQ